MRILVYGAGAVGGFIGGILTAAGADVTLVARVATPFLEVASVCAGLLNQRIVEDGVAFAPAVVKKA